MPSRQRGDRTDGPRTDGPKLWDKASLNMPALAPGKADPGAEGERDGTQPGLTRFVSLLVLQGCGLLVTMSTFQRVLVMEAGMF